MTSMMMSSRSPAVHTISRLPDDLPNLSTGALRTSSECRRRGDESLFLSARRGVVTKSTFDPYERPVNRRLSEKIGFKDSIDFSSDSKGLLSTRSSNLRPSFSETRLSSVYFEYSVVIYPLR